MIIFNGNKRTTIKRIKYSIKTRSLTAISIVMTLFCLLSLIDLIDSSPISKQVNISGIEQDQTDRHQSLMANNDKDLAKKEDALEAQLSSIVQQHDPFDADDRSLAEAIISRLMVDNLFGSQVDSNDVAQTNGLGANSEFANENNNFRSEINTNEASDPIDRSSGSSSIGDSSQYVSSDQATGSRALSGPTGAEAMRLKKLLTLLQTYENLNGGSQSYGLYPVLPASQAATMKRANAKVINYLQQRQAGFNNGRNTFDFGLGKRPDTTGASSNILRLGDSLSGGGGLVQPVNQFGKRPSAHRYDFGLGKRVASSSYPRYDFGLGKRAPNRIRYDFGLGK